MASSAIINSGFFLFVAVLSLSLSVEGREGKVFFSKFTHKEVSPSAAPAVSPSLVPSPAPAPGPAHTVGRHGHAHFGPGSGMIPQTQESWPTTTTTTSDEFDKLLDKLDGEKHNDEMGKSSEEEKYNTDRLTENFEEENYEDEGEERRSKYYKPSEQKSSYYYNNGYTHKNSNYRSNNYKYNDNVRGDGEEKRQGMSDTRFMESGRYFYNMKGENYENERNRHGVEGEGYERTRSARKYPNEFDSMEEYYSSLEGPQQSLP